ncbi:unnamed protein product [Caretta caretta]
MDIRVLLQSSLKLVGINGKPPMLLGEPGRNSASPAGIAENMTCGGSVPAQLTPAKLPLTCSILCKYYAFRVKPSTSLIAE